MTKEEAAKMIRDDMKKHHDYLSGTYRQALNMAIKALEQPECEDAVSREWIRQDICNSVDEMTKLRIAIDAGYLWLKINDSLDNAPSVTPKMRTGKWIHKGCGCFECDQCGELVSTNVYTAEKASDRFKFCPSCGSDMRGEQDAVD